MKINITCVNHQITGRKMCCLPASLDNFLARHPNNTFSMYIYVYIQVRTIFSGTISHEQIETIQSELVRTILKLSNTKTHQCAIACIIRTIHLDILTKARYTKDDGAVLWCLVNASKDIFFYGWDSIFRNHLMHRLEAMKPFDHPLSN